jgi:hypothetical protein
MWDPLALPEIQMKGNMFVKKQNSLLGTASFVQVAERVFVSNASKDILLFVENKHWYSIYTFVSFTTLSAS